MSIAPTISHTPLSQNTAEREPAWLRYTLITLALLAFSFFLLLPLITIFIQAFKSGWNAYASAVFTYETWQSLRLTLIITAAAVLLNTLLGLAAAWAITKFAFPGKSLLLTIIDLPFSISPVAAGLALILIFGYDAGWFGPFLREHDIKIIFAFPGMLLATVFITFPFVAREIIPLMQSQGTEEEQAALVLGARPLQIFLRVTLPNIKWALLYGIILCSARSMGEFGAVAAVSSGFEGNKTLPLYIERAYKDSPVSMVPAFAISTLLTFFALLTLLIKAYFEHKSQNQQSEPLK